MRDVEQSALKQDILPLSVGGGFIAGSTLSDIATIAEQVGIILGACLVFVTLIHRIYIFWKDTHKDGSP